MLVDRQGEVVATVVVMEVVVLRLSQCGSISKTVPVVLFCLSLLHLLL